MPSAARHPMSPAAGLAGLSLVDAARLIRHGEITSLAYAETLLDACRMGATLNAFTAIDADRVREEARAADLRRSSDAPLGRLHGVPIAIKDNIHTAGLPTSGGTAALRGHRRAGDAQVVSRLRGEGAIMFGKTGLHELAMGWTSDNPAFGFVRNPHAPDRIAGGSSGGSAAAVAAAMVPAALGTDTNGSIRIPASLCGIVGYRPSLGRYPMDGIMPLADTLDTVGPMARAVADILLLDAVLRCAPDRQPPAQQPRGMRIGIAPSYFLPGLDREVARVLDEAKRRLADCGITVVTAEIPEFASLATGTAAAIIEYEGSLTLPRYLAAHAPTVTMAHLASAAGPDLHLAAGVSPVLVANYKAALARRQQLKAIYRSHFAAHRLVALMHPLPLMPAPMLGSIRVSPAPDPIVNGRRMLASQAYGRNAAPLSLVGGAGLVLPAGLTSAGLPVGLCFEAPPGHDEHLLDLGLMLHAILGPSPRPTRESRRASVDLVAGPASCRKKD